MGIEAGWGGDGLGQHGSAGTMARKATGGAAKGGSGGGAAGVPAAATGPAKLEDADIEARLAARPEWIETGGAIQRTYQFPGFVDAMRFVNRVAEAAEAAQHHPDILVRYSKVTITLSTHDCGGISAKDFDLAAKLDAMHAAGPAA